MAKIYNCKEITEPGKYGLWKAKRKVRNLMHPEFKIADITVDQEDGKYCVAIGNEWVMTGWKLRTWKTLKGLVRYLEQEQVTGRLRYYN